MKYNPLLGEFDDFFKKHKKLVYMMYGRYASSFNKFRMEKDDMFQEGYAQMYEAYIKYDGRAKVSTFVTACIKFQYNHLLRAARQKKREIYNQCSSLYEKTLDHDYLYEDIIGEKDDLFLAEINACEKLTDREKTIIESIYEGRDQ